MQRRKGLPDVDIANDTQVPSSECPAHSPALIELITGVLLEPLKFSM